MGEMLRAGVYGRQSRGKEKSIAEQVKLCTADALGQGWAVTSTYRDRSSASRYRRREREEWARVVAAIQAREFDVLVLWVSSRGDRDLTSWSGLLDACRSQGVLIRITDDERTYDVRRSGDWAALAQQGVSNATDSDKISAAVRRGQSGAAAAGRPSQGRCPYGYRRVYDQHTGELLGQEIDPTTSPVVREIIERVGKGDPIVRIVKDFNDRQVPTIGAARWYPMRVRDVAMNVAYIGKRTYTVTLDGETVRNEYDGDWPALVDPTAFYAAQRVLTDPSRVTTRPGRYRHLLSYLATTPCGGTLCAVRGRYRCFNDGCVTIVQDDTDDFVEDFIVERLSKPDVYASLRQAGAASDREVLAAESEAAELRDRLNGWRKSAAKGKTTPETMAVIEAELAAEIRDADRRAKRAAIPPALRQILEPGEDVRTRWKAAPLPARRELIRTYYTVSIGPASAPGSRVFEAERISIKRRVAAATAAS